MLSRQYGEYLSKEALAEFSDFKNGRRIINRPTMGFADDTSIIAKQKKSYKIMWTDRLTLEGNMA